MSPGRIDLPEGSGAVLDMPGQTVQPDLRVRLEGEINQRVVVRHCAPQRLAYHGSGLHRMQGAQLRRIGCCAVVNRQEFMCKLAGKHVVG